MNWVYVALAVNSIGTVIAIAYAISARRTAAKRKRRIRSLLARAKAAEDASRTEPRREVPTATGRQRYEASPITPFFLETGTRAPWVAHHADLLPASNCDLSDFDAPVVRPEGPAPDYKSRHDIHRVKYRLQREFHGKPGLLLLNALAISYLRRNTEHTSKARTLFFRIWEDRSDALAPLLSPRWLVSTLRTFQEHGETEEQRLIGATGSLYGYMQRIYESERALSGAMPDDAYLTEKVSADAFGFPGLVPTTASANVSTNHIHAMLIEVSLMDGGAGRVLEELLTQSYKAQNIFARADKARAVIRDNAKDTKGLYWSFHHRRE